MEGRENPIEQTSETCSLNSVNKTISSKNDHYLPIAAEKLELPVRDFKCNMACCCYQVYPGPIFPLRTLSQAECCHLQQLHLVTR